jgi:hypothetical protein
MCIKDSGMKDVCFHQGMPFLLGPMLATGELLEAWKAGLAHPYIYGVIILEAFATYIGQLSVLSLIALFGAATTAMVSSAFQLQSLAKHVKIELIPDERMRWRFQTQHGKFDNTGTDEMEFHRITVNERKGCKHAPWHPMV